jgi:hypothetical protein
VACEPASGVELTWVPAPRALVATWVYSGDSHVGFRITLKKKNDTTGKYEVRASRFIFPNARKYTFRQLHAAPGQTWVAEVTTKCKDCADQDMAPSGDYVIPA